MTVDKARRLRKAQTDAESVLWQYLRNRQLAGYKFRRQYPIEHYIVDFICMSEKLIIELDGSHHATEDQRAYDEVRSQFLQADGYRILRFWNNQIMQSLQETLQTIEQALKAPRPEGEGFGVRANQGQRQ